jgi:hypothetical protein
MSLNERTTTAGEEMLIKRELHGQGVWIHYCACMFYVLSMNNNSLPENNS